MRVLLIFSCIIATLIFRQVPTFSQVPSGRIMHYTQKDGLSFGIINSITQDEKSFMWFATGYGLNRFDGANFKTFKYDPGNPSGLPGNYIQKIFKDSRNACWISSRNGLYKFDPETEHFINYPLVSPPKKVDITGITENKAGKLWISTNTTGFFSLDKQTGTVVSYTMKSLAGLSSNSILSIYEDAYGLLWVGTRDGGINVFRIGNGKIGAKINFDDGKNMGDTNPADASRVNAICNDHVNNIWIATSNGLWLYERRQNKFYVLSGSNYHLRSNFFLSLVQDSHKQLYVGLQDGGVYRLDLNKFANSAPVNFVFNPMEDENGFNITARSVQDMYLDKDENLWLGTYGDGVYMISRTPEKFKRFHQKMADKYGESYIRFYGMCMDDEGYLWLGTDGDGIHKTKADGTLVRRYFADGKKNSLTDNAVLSAFKDSQNTLWFGTYAKGLFRYDKKSDGFVNFPHDAKNPHTIGGNDVRVIHEDQSHNIWVGTNGGGLSKLDAGTRQVTNFNMANSNIGSNDVRSLAHDGQGNLWVGMYGGGLMYFVTAENKFYSFSQYTKSKLNLSTDIIFSLYLDAQKRLWIGTEGEGLLMYDMRNKSSVRFNENNGLANNTVYAIQEESQGEIWVSTNSGLSKLDLSANLVFNFNESDGLQGGQFNSGSALSGVKGSFMCFGGTEGWNLFYPARIRLSKYKPEIRITGLQLYGKEEGDKGNVINISESNQIVLEANQSVFSIQYMAINYAYPLDGNFAYKLEGLDKDWNYVKHQKSATYRYLEPGNYVFKVKASNQDDIWQGNYATIQVKVLPPWYKSWWAYAVYLSFAGVVVYGFIYYKSKQAKLKYTLRIAHIEAEKEKELHENRLSFFTNISHEFRTPLTLIINPVREILYDQEKSSDLSNLNIVYRNAKRLLSLVDQLLLFSKAETKADKLKVVPLNIVNLCKEVFLCFSYQATKKNISYEFICAVEEIEIFGDREKIEIALFNLISNALRHTPESGRVALSIAESDIAVTIQVADTGTGIAAEIGDRIFDRFYKVQDSKNYGKGGFGIGLYLVKSFIESHEGRVSYTTVAGAGTAFELYLLKGKAHFSHNPIFVDQPESSAILEELSEEFEEDIVLGNSPFDEEYGGENGLFTEEGMQEELSSETKTILIIDDNKQIRQYIRHLFKAKFEILEAENGEEGLEMVGRYLPDMIISDVLMNQLNGVELCRRIKSDPALNHIPVILLTASTSSEIKLKGIECGADDYISKPFEKELLIARVEGLLKSRNDLQKYFYNEITLKSGNLKVSAEYKDFLDRCIDIVERHMTDPNFGIKTLAEEIGMSRSNLYIKIKSISGQSANSFIRFIRLRKAAEIFISTELTVQETTFQVGIKDPRYFREQFYKVFNMNPSDYIKKYRKTFNSKYSLNKTMVRPKDNK